MAIASDLKFARPQRLVQSDEDGATLDVSVSGAMASRECRLLPDGSADMLMDRVMALPSLPPTARRLVRLWAPAASGARLGELLAEAVLVPAGAPVNDSSHSMESLVLPPSSSSLASNGSTVGSGELPMCKPTQNKISRAHTSRHEVPTRHRNDHPARATVATGTEHELGSMHHTSSTQPHPATVPKKQHQVNHPP